MPQIILISGNDPNHSEMLAKAVATHNQSSTLIDITGEAELRSASNFSCVEELNRRWPDLKQKVAPWLNLLKLEYLLSQQPPLLPGLEDCLRALFLIDQIKENMNNTIILLMPQPAQAQRFLMGIINTPELIEQIYNPLIIRAEQLKEKLNSLEALFNFKIPQNISQLMPANLNSKLKEVSELLQDPSKCECYLHATNEKMAKKDITQFNLCGIQVKKLWLNYSLTSEELIKINQELSPSTILHANSSNEFESKKDIWLSEQLASETPVIFTEDQEGNSIASILLPCLDKKQLNVQRCGNKLQLSIGCLRRTYPLPSLFNELSPCGARLVDRRLEVRFR
ncbi:ArsA-related P-loop ATPase [Synechococcus sp. UW140]|uniref:ArsA-related P-loop ATPase n=1 Tax=Synechococcus sp. UW140 TaxID=368503 RepID=UPI0025FAFDDB|nr:ArsA-related P-loop ATPase [Synechococcus sp. UW140]